MKSGKLINKTLINMKNIKTYIFILFLNLVTMVSFSQTTSIIDSVVNLNTVRSDFKFIKIHTSAYSIRVVGFVKDNQIYIIHERVDSKNKHE